MEQLFSGLRYFNVYTDGMMWNSINLADTFPCKLSQLITVLFVACLYNFQTVFGVLWMILSFVPILLRFIEFACDQLLDITSECHSSRTKCMMATVFFAQCVILYVSTVYLFILNNSLMRLTRWLIVSVLDIPLVRCILYL